MIRLRLGCGAAYHERNDARARRVGLPPHQPGNTYQAPFCAQFIQVASEVPRQNREAQRLFRVVSLPVARRRARIEPGPEGLLVKSDLRSQLAIAQPRLGDCASAAQVTLLGSRLGFPIMILVPKKIKGRLKGEGRAQRPGLIGPPLRHGRCSVVRSLRSPVTARCPSAACMLVSERGLLSSTQDYHKRAWSVWHG